MPTMETKVRPLKRQRVSGSGLRSTAEKSSLRELIARRHWKLALERLKSHSEEASNIDDRNPSPLALACRLGAPYENIKALVDACPAKLRHLIDSRGTPLHEAVVCDDSGPDVIKLLLQVDEKLGATTPRATMMQDVDGYTPLHLLIRRRFQSHVLGAPGETSSMMEILEMLCQTSPGAIVIPDRTEYEEPPIVIALKAHLYAPLLGLEDTARIEQKINEMVKCMLRHYPKAASCVFSGHRGTYTALHSAVFHGRCAETIELLIEAEKRSPSKDRAGLLANTQGEMPLHFCAMRGEPPRSIALVASAAPDAVSIRDASGLTPIHWLWVRFVSTMLAIDGGRGNDVTLPVQRTENEAGLSDYVAFATLVQGDFETDLTLLRRLDPSVDFLRMRHIPSELLEESEILLWAEKTVELLKRVRARYHERTHDGEGRVVWSRMEAVASLFWTKLVSMLRAIWFSRHDTDKDDVGEDFSLVRTAFLSSSCPPPVARIVASMYPEELSIPDRNGRLPLHHAARRGWHAWDWPREDATSDGANAQLLQLESVHFLKTAMVLSPPRAAKWRDKTNSLPLHYAIKTFVNACSAVGRSSCQLPVSDIHEILEKLLQLNPDSLDEQDPITQLVPFLQATAIATEAKIACSSASFPDEFGLSVVYHLLRENPAHILPGGSL